MKRKKTRQSFVEKVLHDAFKDSCKEDELQKAIADAKLTYEFVRAEYIRLKETFY